MLYNCRADLHTHLQTRNVTHDFNKITDTIRQRLGPEGIIGLINFEDDRYERVLGMEGYERENVGNAFYIPEKDVLVIKGQEVPTKEGHLLVLGLEEGIGLASNRSVEDTLKEARDNNGVIILDHPFYRDGLGNYFSERRRLFEEIDGIETFNGEASLPLGPSTMKANGRALGLYLEAKKDNPHLGAISASDGHSLYEIGKSFTKLPKIDYNSPESLNDSLREGIREDIMRGERVMDHRTGMIGTVDHVADLVSIIALSKVGIKL